MAEAAKKLKAVRAIEQKDLALVLELDLEIKSRGRALEELKQRRDGIVEFVRVMLKQGVAVAKGDLYAEVRASTRQNAVKWMEVCSRELGAEFIERTKEEAGVSAVEKVEVLRRGV